MPDAALQEDKLNLAHRKNSPPKTASFNPKCTGVTKEKNKFTSNCIHLQVLRTDERKTSNITDRNSDSCGRMPEGIGGSSLCISHGQSRSAARRNRDTDKSPA